MFLIPVPKLFPSEKELPSNSSLVLDAFEGGVLPPKANPAV
jgi:hypothetical protein